jgi:hypothetical protein
MGEGEMRPASLELIAAMAASMSAWVLSITFGSYAELCIKAIHCRGSLSMYPLNLGGKAIEVPQ